MTTFTGAADGGGPAADPWLVQPRALIVTIYGLYARDTGGWFSVASLIRLLSELGVEEPAVRSSVSRLKRRGILEPRRANGAAGYGLSARGEDILAEGDRRIFDRPRARLADGWVLAVFSVPEEHRRRRHELRSRLTWLGFGTVSSGVWIAPARLAGETARVLERCGLSGYVTLFRADYQAFGDLREQIPRWWDTGRLQQLYQDFLDAAGPELARADVASPGAAFAGYVRALTAWRRLPFLDPGLPAELLPDGWNGLAADQAFGALRRRLAEPARAHVLAVTGVSR
jgi:phenylacetic acid degradation operon negative regulatory protein